jgi:hypothetical protein
MKKIEQLDKNNSPGLNRQWQGVDKDPEEEKTRAEQVTQEDLKDKKIDADITDKKDLPGNQ